MAPKRGNHIDIDGDEALIKALSANLGAPIQAIAIAVAAEAQDRISPYPPAPPGGNRKRYYQRGFGMRPGRRTSENLGRRWAIKKQGNGAVLQNTTSYGPYVHDAKVQAKIHKRTGWKTDEGIAAQIQNDGTVKKMAEAAIKKQLGVI